MKSILVTGLLFCFAIQTIHAAGQDRGRGEKGASQGADKGATSSTNDQIEVKTDRFSNVTTVTLKPQAILDTPNHVITMAIETKLGEKKFDDFEKEMVEAYVNIESQSKAPVDFGDEELHFIINGQPLNLGETNLKVDPYASRAGKLKPDFRIREYGVQIFDRPALERLSKANRIEMRLGSIEPKLSSQFIATLREYAVQVLAQYKIARQRQQ
jgi:hypothetical protein